MPLVRNGPSGEQLRVAKYRVLHTDLIAAAATQTVDLITLPDDSVVERVWLDNVVAATDAGSITVLTIEVGVTAVDVDAFYPSFDLFGATGRKHICGTAAWLDGDGRTITALFTSTGGNLGNATVTNLDTGTFDITIEYRVVH